MSEERKKILEMLSNGKISVNEAEQLLQAVGEREESSAQDPLPSKKKPKFLMVKVSETDSTGKSVEKVNVRVPLQILRAGVKLASVMPSGVKDKVNDALKEQGLEMDFDTIKPENIEELIEALGDMTVDVNDSADKVHVYCE